MLPPLFGLRKTNRGFIRGEGIGLMMNGLGFSSPDDLLMDFRFIDGFFFFLCDDLNEPFEETETW